MGLEVQKTILAEEQKRDMYPPDGRDLSVELDKTHTCFDRINDEHAAEVGLLSQLVMGISNALVDLGMMPIQHIPQLLKSAREVVGAYKMSISCANMLSKDIK
jgi:hypothetical protein